MTTGLPIIAVPTTYAGSEATPVWGLTEGAAKTTGIDLRVLPKVIVYDAALTTSLPVELSVASGLNALAHCVDAMWGPNADPINAALAAEGIRSLAAGLPKVASRPRGARGPRARPVRGVPVGRRVRLGRLRPAPQDLPRPRGQVQPAARPDARHRAPLRPRVQRPRRSGGRAADRRRVRLGDRDRRPPGAQAAAAAPRTRSATTASPRTRSPRRPTRSCRRSPRPTRAPSPRRPPHAAARRLVGRRPRFTFA